MTYRRSTALLAIVSALVLFAILTPHSAPAAPDPAEITQPAVPPLDNRPFGLNTHLATRYPSVTKMDVPANVLADSGIGWAREDIHWFRVQPTPNTWDWSFTDEAVRLLTSKRIRIVGVIGHPPGWATPFAGDGTSAHSFYAPDIDRFAAFAAEVAKRYRRQIDHWEIWNEPDNDLFWLPKPDAPTYARMLSATAHAIRQVDRRDQILIGGLNPFNTEFLRQVADAGAWKSFDILAIHPYVNPAEPETGNIGASADGMRTLAEQYGQKPIWVTEIGWSSGPGDRDAQGLADAQDQANYLVRATLLLWRAGVERIFWYTLKDDPGNPYGIVALGRGQDDYRTRKPAFSALRTLSRQLSNTTFVGMRDLFTRTPVFDFESFGDWRRGDEPNGEFARAEALQHGGRYAAELRYSFLTRGNNYVVFLRNRPIPIPGQPYALGMWVYGDGSGNTIKLWLRDAEGEVLQFALGTVGQPGWQLLQTPIVDEVPAWNQINKRGNGRLDFPAQIEAVVLDDAPDTFAGSGTIYFDDLLAISGPEAYNIQLQHGEEAVDVLWAPGGLRARLPTSATTGTLIDRDGQVRELTAEDGTFALTLGPDPVYVRHKR